MVENLWNTDRVTARHGTLRYFVSNSIFPKVVQNTSFPDLPFILSRPPNNTSQNKNTWINTEYIRILQIIQGVFESIHNGVKHPKSQINNGFERETVSGRFVLREL